MPDDVSAAIESTDHLATLLQLGQLLNSSLDLKQVLETAIDQVITFVGAERGFILLVDVETGRVWGEALRHIEKTALETTLADIGASTNPAEISRYIVENALDTRQPILSINAMEDPRFSNRQSVQLTHLRSVCCVPLITQGRILGIIYIDNRLKSGVFTERHLSMLLAFANQASVAIQNARLYDNLRSSLEERLRLQDALHRQETQRLALEEAGRLKSDFIGFVAHELRNPLSTIRGYVQTILADEEHTLSEEMKQEFYEAIEADSDRLLDLINELLDISRLEAGRPLTLALKPVNLHTLLEKLARRHKFYKFYTAKHSIVTELSDDLPTGEEFLADEDKLNQIFSNLLSNAIKYSPNGGQITISAYRKAATNATENGGKYSAMGENGVEEESRSEGEDRNEDESEGEKASVKRPENIVIQIRDNGVGMTQDQCSRLFRQYERVERDAIKNIPGTGLGLYLVKSLIELHHGDIHCESTQGQGSTFVVRLPLAAQHP